MRSPNTRFISKGQRLKPWLPTRRKIGDLLEALSALVILSDDVEQPCWIDGRNIAGPVVAVANGLLDITSQNAAPAFAAVTST